MFLQVHQFLGVQQIPSHTSHCLHFNIGAILVALSECLSHLSKLDHICLGQGRMTRKADCPWVE